MLRRFGPMVAIAFLASIVLAACGSGDDQPPPTVTRVAVAWTPVNPPASAAGAASPTAAGGGAAAAAGVVVVDMVDIAFEPNDITIPANTDVTFHIVNKGASQHEFKIDDLKVDSGLVDPGKSVDLKINAPAGEYRFHCPVPGHTEAGMVGTLKVVEGAPLPGGGAATSPAAGGGETPAAGSGAVQTAFTIDMVDIAFQPNELTIPADTDVTITLDNKGAAQHQFKVYDQNIDSGLVDPGKSAEVKVNLPAGDYKFHCPVPGHTEAGMVGVLHVVAGGSAAAGSEAAATSPTVAATEPAAAATTPAETTAPSTAITIDMVDLAFEPKDVTIPANTDVTITLVNKGAAQHQFKVTDHDIDSGPVDPGKSAEVKVNLPAGDYDFHCPIPGHTEAGMVGVLHVVAGGGEAAVSSPEVPATPAATTEAAAAATTPAATTELATAFTIDMVDIAFQPNELTIPADTDVTITLDNKGAAQHQFKVYDQNIDSGPVDPGKSAEVKVNLPPGDYKFHCPIPGHTEAGMVGVLHVK